MTKLILQIFEALRAHALLRWTSLLVLTATLALLLTGQSYKEDIYDFLPLDKDQQSALQEYQNTSSARRIYIIFQAPDSLCQAAAERYSSLFDAYCSSPDSSETFNSSILQSFNPSDAMSAVYARMPHLLTPEDYARIDSLTSAPDFIARQLQNDKQMLMLPTAGMMSNQIRHDPLNLFTPVLERTASFAPDGFSTGTVLLADSPYGASETEHNARLVAMLQQLCDSVSEAYPDVSVHLTGGPVIAVGNAQQIKSDSMLSVTLAVVLILLLLWLAFRNVRNLFLIALSIGWGWLFAMGCLTLVHNDVSIIVIGISSVILGIAVNYPLHLIAHLSHTVDIRSALREIVMPLVVGNITTVGAFLALVPLESVALRDLGLFSAFLLIGTIVFVLLWLPHMVQGAPKSSHSFLSRISDVQLENKSWVVWTVVALTVVLGYFSLQTSFDADLRNINYMTDEQRQDMLFMERFTGPQSQSADLSQWNEWCNGKGTELCQKLRDVAAQEGFADDSFDDFYNLIGQAPTDDGQSLTTTIVSNLSDNFNYIGWTCGFIVFFFLWFSLGSIELALLSFLPMAVSWIWILGIMSLFGIQFNIVNIILATFIFGQGDDYTIFMTEGCQYEYAFRRKMLSSYKHSIIISALIMFIGIGTLIIAKHPALRSLAQVTIAGMFTVVLMAWLLPPFIFRWLVYEKDGSERKQPITWRRLFNHSPLQMVSDRYRYRGIEIASSVNRRLRYWRKHPTELEALSRDHTIVDDGWGETAMLVALQHPQQQYIVQLADEDRTTVARHAIEGLVQNLTVKT